MALAVLFCGAYVNKNVTIILGATLPDFATRCGGGRQVISGQLEVCGYNKPYWLDVWAISAQLCVVRVCVCM